jgi:hypothetical protein
MSRLVKNSGMAARIVKYMSSLRLHFSKENLQPRRKVMMRCSSTKHFHSWRIDNKVRMKLIFVRELIRKCGRDAQNR